MKRLYMILFVTAIIFTACNQGNKQNQKNTSDTSANVVPSTPQEIQSISEVITRFVRGYASKDNSKVNQLIHPDLGVTVIYRPGAMDTFVKTDSIDFNSPVPDYYAYPELENEYALTFEKLPIFSCDTEKWDKQGFICDTTAHPQQLTQIALFENEFNETAYSKETLEEIKKNENASFRVIVTSEEPLIFHVQSYQGKWYVTVLDRAYAGCDA